MAGDNVNKNEAYEGSRIIYNTDELMLLEVLSPESLNYFGPEWIKPHYGRFRDGKLYLIVDKRVDPVKSITIYFDQESDYPMTVYYNSGDVMKWADLEDDYPELTEELEYIQPASEIYDILLSIAQGQKFDKYQLRQEDDLIYNFRYNERNPIASSIVINFDSLSDLMDIFDIEDYDKSFAEYVNSNYGGWDFMDEYTVKDDWKQGYLLWVFRGENRTRLDKILEVITPGQEIEGLESDDVLIAEMLYNYFESEIDDILSTYMNEENYCKNRTARKRVNDELYSFFPEYNLQRIGETDTFVTTVKNLLKLYKKAGNKNLTISQLLKVFGDNYNIDSWSEYAYEMECSDFDDAALDRTVSYNLDDMEEALENSEKFKDVEEFRELVSKITSRYKIGTNYTTPKDNNIRFMISEFDPSDNSVLVMVKNLTNKTTEKRRLDLEGFEMLLNQPELF
jgi:hypothetical protein